MPLYYSNGDVKAEAVRVNLQAQQTGDAISSGIGGSYTPPADAGTNISYTQLTTLVPAWQDAASQGASDSLTQLNSDWDSWETSWLNFLGTLDNVNDLSSLTNYTPEASDLSDDWPNAAGWQQLMTYEASLAALQQRTNNLLNAGLTIVVGPNGQPPSPGGFSPGDWFGGKLGSWGQVITVGCYIVGGGYLLMTFGGPVADLVGLADVPVRGLRQAGQRAVSRQRNPGRRRRKNSTSQSIATLESNRSDAAIARAQKKCGCDSGPTYRAALLRERPMTYVSREYSGR
jgi:hypothetical protein